MANEISNWTIKDWLESIAYAVAIIGAFAGAIIYFINNYNESIRFTSKAIIDQWTNEGDISSSETNFIALELENHSGDIIGSLTSTTYDHPLDINAGP